MSNMSRTNVVLDDDLIARGLKLTGLKTKRALLEYALNKLIKDKYQKSRQKEILKLQGKIHWEGNLNESRRGRTD